MLNRNYIFEFFLSRWNYLLFFIKNLVCVGKLRNSNHVQICLANTEMHAISSNPINWINHPIEMQFVGSIYSEQMNLFFV